MKKEVNYKTTTEAGISLFHIITKRLKEWTEKHPEIDYHIQVTPLTRKSDEVVIRIILSNATGDAS